MTTPHQTENGYENATDEEKTKMMLQIAKEANAEQKAMCEPEKQPWEERFDEAFGRFSLGENNGREKGWRSIDMLKPFISQLLKEEQPCLCKDKGVIELIEEAVEAERESKDNAYKERDMLVCALSKLFPAYLARHDENDETWEREWMWIVYIELPTGQVSWHIHDSEKEMFNHLEVQPNNWDGHNTERKYQRLKSLDALQVINKQL